MVNLCGRLTALYALIIISSQNRLTYSTCHIPSSSRTRLVGVFLAAISTLKSHIHAGLVRVFSVKRTKTRHSDYDISPTARLSQHLARLASATLGANAFTAIGLVQFLRRRATAFLGTSNEPMTPARPCFPGAFTTAAHVLYFCHKLLVHPQWRVVGHIRVSLSPRCLSDLSYSHKFRIYCSRCSNL